MQRTVLALLVCVLVVAQARVGAQAPSGGSVLASAMKEHPVTAEVLSKPDPADWLMYSRTYDAQRFSPLDEIDRRNVGYVAARVVEAAAERPDRGIPLVYRGVMYLLTPGGRDGGSRDLGARRRERRTCSGSTCRPTTASSRIKALAIYEDMIYYTAPAPSGEPNPVIALDAATGKVRWRRRSRPENHTAGAIVVEGKVISGRTCNTERSNCYISALDANTGKEAWRFYTSPGRRRARRRIVGRRAVDAAARGDLGLAGHLRSRAQADLLGHREPDAEHARRAAWRQRRRDSARPRPPTSIATRRSR